MLSKIIPVILLSATIGSINIFSTNIKNRDFSILIGDLSNEEILSYFNN